MKIGDSLYCTKDLPSSIEGADFKKGCKYPIIWFYNSSENITLIDEHGNTHDVNKYKNSGWGEYFLTEKELRERKLKRILK